MTKNHLLLNVINPATAMTHKEIYLGCASTDTQCHLRAGMDLHMNIITLVACRRDIDGHTFAISLIMVLNAFNGVRRVENVSTVSETDCRLPASEEEVS
jgi:hypothetical protein